VATSGGRHLSPEEPTMDLPAPVPDACTLPTVERPVRVAAWDSLFRELVSVDQSGSTRGRLVFAAAPGLEDRVRDLSRRETECCSFFEFSVEAGTDAAGRAAVVLDVRVPPTQAEVLESFVRWADDVQSGRRQVGT
jgi:hypothetical protein